MLQCLLFLTTAGLDWRTDTIIIICNVVLKSKLSLLRFAFDEMILKLSEVNVKLSRFISGLKATD